MTHFKRILSILLLNFLILTNLYAEVVSENHLGFEDSQGLRDEIEKNFLDEGHGLNPQKLGKIRSLNEKRRKQIFDQLVLNELNSGKTQLVAEKKAAKNKLVRALDIVLSWMDKLEKEPSLVQQAYLMKKILRISGSFIRNGSEPDIVQSITGLTTWIFENYNIPINDLRRPQPSNLYNKEENRYYKKDELKEMIKRGVDVSNIDPPNNSYWNKPNFSIPDKNPLYPMEMEGKVPNVFNFKKVIKNDSKAKIKVDQILPNGKKVKWKLKIGREVNTEFVVSRLYDLVGYNSDRYYYVKTPKVYFKSEEHWKDTVHEWISFYETEYNLPSNYIKTTGTDEKGFYVVFWEGLLEARPKKTKRIGRFHLSYMGNWDRREVRAQLLLNAFVANVDFKEDRNNKTKLVKNPKTGIWEVQELTHDVGYSFGNIFTMNLPNGYKWSFLKRKRSKITFDYERFTPMKKKVNPYQVVTYSDLKWMAKYFVQITKEQFITICNNSGWPKEVARLFLEKMIKRRNEVVRVFQLKGQIIDGHEIKVWDEVNPKRFNLGDAIKKGKLVKTYKAEGSVNFYKFEYDILNFGGKTLVPLMGMLYKSITMLPFHKILNYPLASNSLVVDKQYIGAGIGIRFKRDIDRNTDLRDENKGWVVTDKLEIYGLAGGGFSIPIAGGLAAEFEARGIFGKEWILKHYNPSLRKAATANFKRILKMPFKQKDSLKELGEGESMASALFVGFEMEQELSVGPEPARTVTVGVGLEQRKKYLMITKVDKKENNKIEVTKAKAHEFTFTFKAFVEVFNMLEIKFFEAGIMLGKSKGKTFYFDMEKNKEANHIAAFNQAIFTTKTDLAEEIIPFSITTEKYIEKHWRLSFLASMGTKSRAVYGITLMPDDSIKRYFKYNTLHDRVNIFNNVTQNHKVWAEMEFTDDKFENVLSRKLYLNYEVKDLRSTPKKMTKRIRKINTLVAQNNFIKFDTELFSDRHLGDTHTNLNMNFTESSLKCLLDKIGCEAKGPKAYKVGKHLSRIRKYKRPTKRLRKLADYVRRAIGREKNMKSLLQFVGRKKLDVELLIFGENLPMDRHISLRRPAEI